MLAENLSKIGDQQATDDESSENKKLTRSQLAATLAVTNLLSHLPMKELIDEDRAKAFFGYFASVVDSPFFKLSTNASLACFNLMILLESEHGTEDLPGFLEECKEPCLLLVQNISKVIPKLTEESHGIIVHHLLVAECRLLN